MGPGLTSTQGNHKSERIVSKEIQVGLSYSSRLSFDQNLLSYAENHFLLFDPETGFNADPLFPVWFVPYSGFLYEFSESRIQIGATIPAGLIILAPIVSIPGVFDVILHSPGIVLRVPIDNNLYLTAKAKLLEGSRLPVSFSSSLSLEYVFS